MTMSPPNSPRSSRHLSPKTLDARDETVSRLHTLRTRRKRARQSIDLLKASYRSPLLNNKDDPLDELVFIILSQMTTSPSYERVFERLKGAMPDWRILTETPVFDLTSLIADAGLSGQRALRLKQIADRLVQDFGEVSLTKLVNYDDETVQQYLTSLPGVGVKTAKCVMMYSLGRQVLPVDTHTARVATRLGLVPAGSAAAIDRDLSIVVPPALRFDFHVNAVAHGRAVCRAVRPRCDDCVLSSLCPVWAQRQPTTPKATKVTMVTGGHVRTSDDTIDPHILAEPVQAIPPSVPQTTRMRDGKYATDLPLPERDEPLEVVTEPIDAVEVGRPLGVLSLPEEQAWSVDMEAQHVRASTVWQRHLEGGNRRPQRWSVGGHAAPRGRNSA